MKPNSDFNDIHFEFLFFDALKESHIQIMFVKIDDNWTSNLKLYQIQRKMKKRLKFYDSKIEHYPKLEIPGIKKIMKMILVLQENPEKLDELEKKVQGKWKTYVKKHDIEEQEKKKKKKAKQLEKENKEDKKQQDEWVKDVIVTAERKKEKKSQKTNEDNDLAVTTIENNYYKNHKKRKDEEKRLRLHFNNKLDVVLRTFENFDIEKVIGRLEELIPPSDDWKLTNFTGNDIDVVDRWRFYIYTLQRFYELFPHTPNKLENDISKMECKIKNYKDQRNEKYSGRP